MSFEFLKELNETKMFRTETSVNKLGPKDVADMFFLHIIGLEILKTTYSTMKFAQDYAKKIQRYKSFNRLEPSSVDMYQLVWALVHRDEVFDDETGNDEVFANRLTFDKMLFRHYIDRIVANNINYDEDRRFTLKLSMGLQQDSTRRSMRRLAIDWDILTKSQREILMTRLMQQFRKYLIKSDMYPALQKVAKEYKLIIDGVYNPETGEVEGETEHSTTFNQKLLKGAATAGAAYAIVNMLRSKKRTN